MENEVLVGKVQTVSGVIDAEALGVTMAHEHLLLDISHLLPVPDDPERKKLFEQPVSMEITGQLRHGMAHNRDDNRLLDVDTAIAAAALFKQHGGQTIVECTINGLHRDPQGLLAISRATGLHIVMGSSYYVDAAHPPEVDQMSEDSIVAEIVRDVTVGVGTSGIRAGMVGEVGCSFPLTKNERKVLRASARAQRLTGAPLMIHPGRNEQSPREIVEVLRDAGADVRRTILCHVARTIFEDHDFTELAELGFYLEWDMFGWENSFYWPEPTIDVPNDATRMKQIQSICAQGYSDRILISQDICTKARLSCYGGHGYHYILEGIVPRMRARGFEETWIDNMLVNNPSAIFAFVEPIPT
ncbi:MAG: hypothetical protein QGF67_14870 [Lentisphaeria bacterium]|jgi:phosphotriesterase-related protein|nr:hypothetical protein [Lentisphaeria bacterium]